MTLATQHRRAEVAIMAMEDDTRAVLRALRRERIVTTALRVLAVVTLALSAWVAVWPGGIAPI